MNFFTSQIAKFLLKKPVFKYLIKEIYGLENVPKGNFILASNHQSHLDQICNGAVLILSGHYNFHFLGQTDRYSGITKIFLYILYFLTGTIPVNRNDPLSRKKAIEKVIEKLNQKKVVIIYPEGTRSRDGKIGKPKLGIAKIVLKTKVPVLPVAIKGSFESLKPGEVFPKLERAIVIKVGKPLYFEKEIEMAKNLDESSNDYQNLLENITQKIMEEIKILYQQLEIKV
jgi:1-acyl-sn-glycerol-3-phosphate acyltransferase